MEKLAWFTFNHVYLNNNSYGKDYKGKWYNLV